MKIQLIAIGNRMPAWVTQGYEEYARRLSRECILELVEIAPGRRGKGDARNAMAEEGERMRKAIPGGWRVVAMEVTGRSWTTEKLAERCAFWQQDARDVALLVGGPEGLAPECQALAEERWSLSPLTLPHPLVRVIVAEQLYRAWSILNNHPYHRA